mmetsp:Transcript_29253/g.56694  ORF Transcript_29253/g.56694 Transcript_29253/m.56694 type:complete len:200 (-) Transcript_29253:3933-4532(-)
MTLRGVPEGRAPFHAGQATRAHPGLHSRRLRLDVTALQRPDRFSPHAHTTRAPDHAAQLADGCNARLHLGRHLSGDRDRAGGHHAVLAGRRAHRVCSRADDSHLARFGRQAFCRSAGSGRSVVAGRHRWAQFGHPVHAAGLGSAIRHVRLCGRFHGFGRPDRIAPCAFLCAGRADHVAQGHRFCDRIPGGLCADRRTGV